MSDFTAIASEVGALLQTKGLQLVTAESCTGGWVAQVVTIASGSSQWFDRGFITYSNLAKQQVLGVSSETLEQFGAVSEQTAQEMAQGALAHSDADVSLAVTGVAGPTGGTPEKPVGMVCFSWAIKGHTTQAATQYFEGDRTSIRSQSVEYVLEQLVHWLKL